jgi:hypothetical protein
MLSIRTKSGSGSAKVGSMIIKQDIIGLKKFTMADYFPDFMIGFLLTLNIIQLVGWLYFLVTLCG